MAGTPNYPRDAADDLRDLRAARTAAQTAGQSRVAFRRTTEGLEFDDLGAHPDNPPAGSVILYGFAGHLWCRKATGSPQQLTT